MFLARLGGCVVKGAKETFLQLIDKSGIQTLSFWSSFLPTHSIYHQININPPQCLNDPSRILALIPSIERPKIRLQKLRVSICNNSFPDPPHQVEQIMHIVYTQQMRACSFLGGNVMDVGACETQAAGRHGAADSAFAVWVYG